ncbi:hypothetical protein LOK49_LG08G00064 [Camellia lanceoleosa]|uniref:Uncharacterized protein n=1 Tax=Camellia lanceoleosa TaxID=1840588 RepID=A0ACC0GYS7_9ERIC|nr:hypothetical protein LOK49_LG08G00064 [Camellia lanceoleosa]
MLHNNFIKFSDLHRSSGNIMMFFNDVQIMMFSSDVHAVMFFINVRTLAMFELQRCSSAVSEVKPLLQRLADDHGGGIGVMECSGDGRTKVADVTGPNEGPIQGTRRLMRRRSRRWKR